MSLFYEQVYDVVRQIPYGKVVSYVQIARALGRPRAAREVGRAMFRCRLNIPCHRVVKADGTVAGGSYAPERRADLEAEDIPFLPDGRVDMEQCRWDMDGLSISDGLLP